MAEHASCIWLTALLVPMNARGQVQLRCQNMYDADQQHVVHAIASSNTSLGCATS